MLRTGSSKSEHHMTAEHTKPTKASDVIFLAPEFVLFVVFIVESLRSLRKFSDDRS